MANTSTFSKLLEALSYEGFVPHDLKGGLNDVRVIGMTHLNNKALWIRIKVTVASNGAYRGYCNIMDNRLGSSNGEISLDGAVKDVPISLADSADVMNTVMKMRNDILTTYQQCNKPYAITGKVVNGKSIVEYQLCNIQMNKNTLPKEDVFKLAQSGQIQCCNFQTMNGKPLLTLKYNDLPIVKSQRQSANPNTSKSGTLESVANSINKLLSEKITFDKFSLEVEEPNSNVKLSGTHFGLMMQRNGNSVDAYVIEDFGDDGWDTTQNQSFKLQGPDDVKAIAKFFAGGIMYNRQLVKKVLNELVKHPQYKVLGKPLDEGYQYRIDVEYVSNKNIIIFFNIDKHNGDTTLCIQDTNGNDLAEVKKSLDYVPKMISWMTSKLTNVA